MQPSQRQWSGLLMAGGVAVVLAGCGNGPAPLAAGSSRPATTAVAAGSPRPYQLYTHCGIDEARIGNRY